MLNKKRIVGKINLLPLVVLFVTLIILVSAAFSLRYWQNSRRTSEGFRLGEIAYNQQNWSEAARQYGYFLSKNSKNNEVLAKYAEVQLNIRPLTQGQISQAISSYRQILRNDPDNIDALKKVSEIYISVGSAGESELLLGEYLKNHPEEKEIHSLYAVALLMQQKDQALSKAMNDYPDFKTSYYQSLYSLQVKAGNYQQAAEMLKGIISEHPDEIKAYDLLARVINTSPQSFSDSPLKWINMAVDIAPSNPQALINRASFYISQKNNDLALVDLNQAVKFIEEQKSDSTVQLQAAALYAMMGDYETARSICAVAYDSEPNNLKVLTALVNYATIEGDKLRLEEITDNALEKLDNSNKWDFIPTAIESYVTVGNVEKASELIAQIEKSNTMPSMIAYWKGLIAGTKENINDQISFLSQAIQLGYTNNKAKFLLANAYENNNDIPSAIMQLKLILNSTPNPNNVQVMTKLGELYLRLYNYNEAQSIASQILQTSPNSSQGIMLSLKATVQGADREKLKTDNTYYNQLMDKIKNYRFGIEQPYQLKVLQFQLALAADKGGDAQAIIKEIEQTSIPKEQLENLYVAYYMVIGEKDKALAILSKQLSGSPDNIDLIIRQVSLLVSNKQIKAAELIIDKTLEKADLSNLALKKLMFAKADLFNLDTDESPAQPDKAIETIIALHEKLPNDISTIQRLLSFEKIRKDNELASKYINAIKKIEGDDGRVWRQEQARFLLSADKISDQQLNESIGQLKDIIAQNPGDLASIILLAMFYEKNDQFLLAADLWQDAYNNNIANFDYALNACRCLQAAGKFNESDELTSELLRRYPDNPTLISLEVNRLMRTGNNTKAAALLEDLYSKGSINESQLLLLANIKTSQEDYATAHKYYDEILADDEFSFQAIAAKAAVYALEKKYDEAFIISEKAIKHFDSAQAYLLKARLMIESEKTDQIEAVVEEALKKTPTPEDYLNAISIFISIENSEKAVALAKQSLEIYPDNVNLATTTIQLLLGNTDNTDEGNALLEKSLKAFPNSTTLKFIKATMLYNSGTKPDLDKAVTLLDTIVENEPENIRAWLMLGEIEYARQQYQKVVDIVYQALSFNPDNSELMLLKAKAENEISPELAEATLKTLQSINTSDSTIAIRLAGIYSNQGKIADALKLLQTAEKLTTDEQQLQNISLLRALISYKEGDQESRKAVEKIAADEPDNLYAINIMAEMMAFENQWSEIKALGKTWISNNPENYNGIYSIIRVLLRYQRDLEGDNKVASKDLILELTDMILEESPDNTMAMQIQANILINDKNTQKAIETYRKILKSEPDNVIAINNLAWMVCEEQNKPKEALDIALKGIELAPNYADLIDTTGTIYYRLNNYEKAIELYKQCIELYNTSNPALTSTYLHIGKAYYKLNNKVEANSYLNKALEYNENSNNLTDKEINEINELLK